MAKALVHQIRVAKFRWRCRGPRRFLKFESCAEWKHAQRQVPRQPSYLQNRLNYRCENNSATAAHLADRANCDHHFVRHWPQLDKGSQRDPVNPKSPRSRDQFAELPHAGFRDRVSATCTADGNNECSRRSVPRRIRFRPDVPGSNVTRT